MCIRDRVKPNTAKKGAYSFIKAPRYNGAPMEVGPLARMYVMGEETVTQLGEKAFSVLGRHLARALECSMVAKAMGSWVTELEIGQPVCTPHKIPDSAQGVGLNEGPRGALGPVSYTHLDVYKRQAISLSGFLVPFIKEAAAAGGPPVIWIQGGSCTGCSISILNTVHPDIEKVITEVIGLHYHPNLSAGAGSLVIDEMYRVAAENSKKFYLVRCV